jgi:hypothetical protein
MAAMSMNKAIHQAFRRDLDRFVDALGRFPAGDLVRARELGTAWANFEDQLQYHHQGEHDIAWKALVQIGVSPQVLSEMDSEHDVMSAALAHADRAVKQLKATAGADDAQAALAAVTELRRVTLEHLEHEEAEIEQVYLDKVDTPEIKAMGRQFGKVSPMRGGRFFAWVLDGATEDERAAITGTVPGPVLKIIGLFGFPYRRNVAPVWKGPAGRVE